MFKCYNCLSENYLYYEQKMYKCNECMNIYNYCLDCIKYVKFPQNLEILKNKYSKLFRYYKKINYYIKNLNLSQDINNIIIKYLDNIYCYKHNYFFSKFNFQYISLLGIQIYDDDNTHEFLVNPVLICNKCLQKYDYYCIIKQKFIS